MISNSDALIADPGYRYDYILTNPPFGKKSSMTFTNEEGEQEKEELTYNRQDFWTTTNNNQLNRYSCKRDNREYGGFTGKF